MSNALLRIDLEVEAVIAIVIVGIVVVIGLYIFFVYKYRHPNLAKRAGEIKEGMDIHAVYDIMRYPSAGAIQEGEKITVVWCYGKRNINVVFVNERVSAVEVIYMGEPPL